MLIGSATRFIAGRNAVQTVYWRKANSSAGAKFLKYNRTCTFDKKFNASNNFVAKISAIKS